MSRSAKGFLLLHHWKHPHLQYDYLVLNRHRHGQQMHPEGHQNVSKSNQTPIPDSGRHLRNTLCPKYQQHHWSWHTALQLTLHSAVHSCLCLLLTNQLRWLQMWIECVSGWMLAIVHLIYYLSLWLCMWIECVCWHFSGVGDILLYHLAQ